MKNATKHTPGPWLIDDGVSEDGPMICGPDGFLHAQVFGNRTSALANSQLIAAAPELLEALLVAYKAAGKNLSYGETKLIQDAIGKATGEEISLVLSKAKGEL